MTDSKAKAFTEDEDAILMRSFDDNRAVLMGAFEMGKESRDEKRAVWDAIAVKVSACAVAVRTGAQCKRRLGNIKQSVKAKSTDEKQHRNLTGGGRPLAEASSCEDLKRRCEIKKNRSIDH